MAKKLCPGIAPVNFAQAKRDYPSLEYALEAVEAKPVATWYTDRSQYLAEATATLAACAPRNGRLDTLPTFVVYGLPNKDCHGSFSGDGVNRNAADYIAFVSKLASLVGKQDVLYVLEPDAMGLLAESPTACGWDNNYLPNMAAAVTVLTKNNPAAKLYVDVGWWLFKEPARVESLVALMKALAQAGPVRGIVLNTSNYRSNDELLTWCKAFVDATPGMNFKCVFDTSRNFHGASPTGEWCNANTAGIGVPPTDQTGTDVVDYFLWLKTPGQSDGECNVGVSADAMPGPAAGQFFEKGFSMMFDNGYFVAKAGLPKIGKYAVGNGTAAVDDGSSISGAAIGIVVGVIVAMALLVVGGGLWLKKRKSSKRQQPQRPAKGTTRPATDLQTQM
ncbi:hypothetical protein H310_08345 [Aphanomyces invadans]|uniref:Glycoside hydrolase n=1 Tax=Aphanomyces invadans TaxID=157072 RepID=A0A024TXX8_9STRA|nr:hypothetical protein H310_08345 [Aphanomyces invadans]ETV98844.1 hypothetical protein H310_08345 [Aphanomyces invadans]|eukprot:XP_008872272.1 hypothetical protein H310_08345 [Aphanomyces invadans]